MSFTLQDGVDLIRIVEPILIEIGYHCALHGSVLYKGASEKDIDIIIYPHKIDSLKPEAEIFTVLLAVGITPTFDHPRSKCDKVIWPCSAQGRRVDLFFMK